MAPKSGHVYIESEFAEYSAPVSSRLVNARPQNELQHTTDTRAIVLPSETTPPRNALDKGFVSLIKQQPSQSSDYAESSADDLVDAIAAMSINAAPAKRTGTPIIPLTADCTEHISTAVPILSNPAQPAHIMTTPPRSSRLETVTTLTTSSSSLLTSNLVDEYDSFAVNESDVKLLCEFTYVSADKAREALRYTFGGTITARTLYVRQSCCCCCCCCCCC